MTIHTTPKKKLDPRIEIVEVENKKGETEYEWKFYMSWNGQCSARSPKTYKKKWDCHSKAKTYAERLNMRVNLKDGKKVIVVPIKKPKNVKA